MKRVNYALDSDGPQLEVNFTRVQFGMLNSKYEKWKAHPRILAGRLPRIFQGIVEGVIKWNIERQPINNRKQTVKTRFELKDADLCSFKFRG